MPLIGWCSYGLDELGIRTIAVTVSAILYGGLLFLTLSYIPLLLKTSCNISRRMRNFLLVYVTIMVAISTAAIITTIVALVGNMVFQRSNQGLLHRYCMNEVHVVFFQDGMLDNLFTALATWGADWFMLWRCAMLYEGVSRPRRIALIAVLASVAIVSFGLCLYFYIDDFQGTILLFITSVTVILNLVTATLITLRILYFDRYIRKTVGWKRNSPYMTIISICVESSALIVVVSLIYMILFLTGYSADNALLILIQALVHIYVISPLLIVYRVAQGKAATIRQRPSEGGPVVSVLCFAPQRPESSSGNNTV